MRDTDSVRVELFVASVDYKDGWLAQCLCAVVLHDELLTVDFFGSGLQMILLDEGEFVFFPEGFVRGNWDNYRGLYVVVVSRTICVRFSGLLSQQLGHQEGEVLQLGNVLPSLLEISPEAGECIRHLSFVLIIIINSKSVMVMR